jgi:hypothetical protein
VDEMMQLKYVVIALIMIVSVLPLSIMASQDEGGAQARGVPRAVLGELFTAVWCGYCPAADNAFHNLINNATYFPNRLTTIEWHPTDSDQYGTAETDNVISNYYGIQGFPTAIFDGVSIHIGGSTDPNDPAVLSDYQSRIDARPATSPISLQVDAKIINNAVTYAGVNVTAIDSVSSFGNLMVKAVVVEDLQLVHNNGNLRWTARDVLFSDALSINQGETKEFSATGTLDGGWDTARLGVVAYVQDDNTKEVLQSIQVTSMPKVTDSSPVVSSAPGPISFPEDTKYASLDLNTVFSDPDKDPMTFGFSGNSKINVTIAGGIATLTPDKNWNGMETIRFTAKDQFNPGGVYTDVQVTVTAVNDPTYVKKFIVDFTMVEGQVKTGPNLDDIFADIDSQLTFSSIGSNHINVSINPAPPRAVTFTAPDLWVGKETIMFHATDGQYEATATVNVTVLHTNHAPTAKTMQVVTLNEDGMDTSIDLANVFTDLDGFDTLTFTYEETGGHITVAIDASGKVTLTPAPIWWGTETVVFSASDGIAAPATASLDVTVLKVNYAPEVVGKLEKMVFDEGTSYSTTKTLRNVFKDRNSDPLELSVDYDQANMTVEINTDGTVSITPMQYTFGNFTLGFTATDPEGKFSVYNCPVTITEVNYAPIIKSVKPAGSKSVTMNENETMTFSVVAYDVNGNPVEYTWNLDGREQSADGPEFTFSPDFSAAGNHKLTVVVSHADLTAEQSWTIKVMDVNRAPVLTVTSPANGAVFKSGAKIQFVATATDPDNNKLTYTWTCDGQIIGQMADITVTTIKPGTHIIKCEVNDGQTAVTSDFTIKVNSPPAKSTPGFEGVLVLGGMLVALCFLGRRK